MPLPYPSFMQILRLIALLADEANLKRARRQYIKFASCVFQALRFAAVGGNSQNSLPIADFLVRTSGRECKLPHAPSIMSPGMGFAAR